MPDTHIDTLIQHYLDGTLTEDEAARLHQQLTLAPELGARLLDHVAMDAMLRATKPVIPLPSARPGMVPKRRFSAGTLSGVAALAACATLLLNLAWMQWKTPPVGAEDTTASIAVLTQAVNLQWESDTMKPTPGSPLLPGWLRLKSGQVQIEFYQGARVTLEGPAAFQLISSGEAYCRHGKLSAHVPPQARGFRINTPRGNIVDLGTEFGLNVDAEGAEVHVFDGEVELHQGTSMKPLKQGEAASLVTPGGPSALPANAAAFASLRDLDARSAESLRADFERWLTLSQARNSDPDLLLRFDFQEALGARTLHNRSAHHRDVPDGSIVGSAWTEGRWPGKQALEFRNVSDRVRLTLPEETSALTLTAWVRVAGLDRAFNSLFMGEGWGNRNVHWQITRDGRLRLGVAGQLNAGHQDYDTPAIFTPERFGQWLHLATVFDPVAREVRHYVNGEQQSRAAIKTLFPLRLSLAELGNWNNGTRGDRTAIRHFSGAMDEFALYRRALAPEEIARLAE